MDSGKPVKSVRIEGFVCPFCGHEEGILTEAKIDYGSHEEGFGHDYWDCTECGSVNHIFSAQENESLFGETPFFADADNWNGLESHLRFNKETASMEALFYARFLTQ